MTNPASTPATTPARTHATNMAKLMTLPPSSGYGSPASLHWHRVTRDASSPLAPVGWTRAHAPLARGRSGRRPVAVLPHDEGREHFDRPRVEGPVVDHHLYGGGREPAEPLGRRGGGHDDVHSSHQTTQGRPLGGGNPHYHQVWEARAGGCGVPVVGALDGAAGDPPPRGRR